MKIIISIITVLIFGGTFSFAKQDQAAKAKSIAAEEEHDHEHEAHSDEKEADEHEGEHKDEHKDEHNGEHEDEHDHGKEAHAPHDGAHEEEENSSVGPKQGITIFSESEGFKLSPEAVKNFELQTIQLKNVEPWTVPSSAILYSGEEVNVYRVRAGFYKRIDFSILSKNGKDVKIKSRDLKVNDEIVIQGVAFLRSAEIVATGGAPEGHSH